MKKTFEETIIENETRIRDMFRSAEKGELDIKDLEDYEIEESLKDNQGI